MQKEVVNMNIKELQKELLEGEEINEETLSEMTYGKGEDEDE